MISLPLTTLDTDVFDRFSGLSLPRHVSYPMPSAWVDAGPEDAEAMRRAVAGRTEPIDLSLYVHIPFCSALCKFCACSRIVLRKTAPGAAERVEAYVAALEREIARLGAEYGPERFLRQIHWGGGTPTYLSEPHIERIVAATQAAFTIAPDAEVSIEVDPRVTTSEQLFLLRRLGFNRISLGVQDFDARVQEHVRRVQPLGLVKQTVDTCRELGYDSINFDLIYGLPYQTLESMRETIEHCIELSPDRIAYYHYAQIPDRIATQRAIHHEAMPDSHGKLEMFMLGVSMFEEAGYEFIGLDHFARPREGLARAARAGTLQRNFQGMTTGGGLDLLGAGASSISHLLGAGFLQNERDPDRYVECFETGAPILRKGKPLTDDDVVRQAVISQIYCGARIVPAVIEARFGIDFASTFAGEMKCLAELQDEGLVTIDDAGNVDVTFPLGRVLLRNIAAIFDAYLPPDAYRVGVEHCFSTNA